MVPTRRSNAGWLVGLVLLGVTALPASGMASEPQSGFWMASSSYGAGQTGNTWGRLIVKDGMLTFFASRGEWRTPVAEIKRVSMVKGSNSFEIETLSGSVLRLSILGPQMLVESPKKAMQLIQRAVREAPASQRPAVSVTASGSGSSIR